MALTKCKECSHEVSTTAKICQNCGAPNFLPDDVKEELKKEELRKLIAREKPGRLPYTSDREKLKHFVEARTTGKKMPRRSHQERHIQQIQSASNARIIGLIGVAILFVGVFMPIISVPVMGSINYFNNGKGDGTIIIVLAILSLILILAGSFRFLWLTGGLSLAVLIYTYAQLQSRLNASAAELRKELAGNPFAGLATGALDMVQIQWGWALLVVGAVLILVAAGIYETKR